MVGWVIEYRKGRLWKRTLLPWYLGQCMVGRVSYLGRVKQGNYHTHVLYTIPNPNYTLPKPYPFIITYPIPQPTLGTQTGRVLPCAGINTTLPWIPTYPYPSIVIPYPSTYPTLPTVGKIPLPTLSVLEGNNLENVESIKYLGVTITSDLRWNTHVSNVCTKANRTLGFLRRNLYSCTQEVKEAAYKGLVRPVLDYDSSVWDPPGVVLQEELESVQKRAARFVTSNNNYETGSMTGILGQLKWESLKKRRKDNRLILLYKGLKGKASVPIDDLNPKTRRCRNQHSLAFQTPIANTDVYKGSVFPQTIRDRNALPDSLISSAEDAEDCVAKFTSLVRARN